MIFLIYYKSCLWHHSQAVRQRSAKPSSPVQIWVVPPKDVQTSFSLADVAEQADARDLKSLGVTTVPVQVRSSAPSVSVCKSFLADQHFDFQNNILVCNAAAKVRFKEIIYMEIKDRTIALLIDSDNISSDYFSIILDELSQYGKVTYRRLYGDFTNPKPMDGSRFCQSILLNRYSRLLLQVVRMLRNLK